MNPAHIIALMDVYKAAQAYRAAEQDDTPRLWRGKALHEAGELLSAKIAAMDALLTGAPV